MWRLTTAGSAALISAVLFGCTVPGVPRTEILSRQMVSVDGRQCQHVSRRTETATVNGMHRYEDSVIRCDGIEYACDSRTPEQCAAAIAAGPDRRNGGGATG